MVIAKFLAQNLALRIPFLKNHKRTMTVVGLCLVYCLNALGVIDTETAMKLNGGLTLFGGLAITHAIAKKVS